MLRHSERIALEASPFPNMLPFLPPFLRTAPCKTCETLIKHRSSALLRSCSFVCEEKATARNWKPPHAQISAGRPAIAGEKVESRAPWSMPVLRQIPERWAQRFCGTSGGLRHRRHNRQSDFDWGAIGLVRFRSSKCGTCARIEHIAILIVGVVG